MTVNIQECRAAISRLTQGRGRLRVPARREDDDLLLVQAIDEIECLRAQVAAREAVVVAARAYLAPDTAPIPERMRESDYGRLLQAMRDYDGPANGSNSGSGE